MALEDSPVHVPSLPPQQLVICHTETQGDTRKHKSWTRGDAHLKILASDILMLLSYQSSSLFCRILLLKAVSRLKMIIVQEKKREKRIFYIKLLLLLPLFQSVYFFLLTPPHYHIIYISYTAYFEILQKEDIQYRCYYSVY